MENFNLTSLLISCLFLTTLSVAGTINPKLDVKEMIIYFQTKYPNVDIDNLRAKLHKTEKKSTLYANDLRAGEIL